MVTNLSVYPGCLCLSPSVFGEYNPTAEFGICTFLCGSGQWEDFPLEWMRPEVRAAGHRRKQIVRTEDKIVVVLLISWLLLTSWNPFPTLPTYRSLETSNGWFDVTMTTLFTVLALGPLLWLQATTHTNFIFKMEASFWEFRNNRVPVYVYPYHSVCLKLWIEENQFAMPTLAYLPPFT